MRVVATIRRGSCAAKAFGRIGLLVCAGVGVLLLAGLCFWCRAEVTGSSPEGRIACIGRLADEQPWGAADAIAAAAGEDPDPRVRHAALLMLGRFVRRKDRALIESASESAEPLVRCGGAATLGHYGDASAVDRLAALAAEDADEDVRAAAVLGLSRTGQIRALGLLVRNLSENSFPSVRLRALEAVERVGKFRFAEHPDPQSAEWQRLAAGVRRLPGIPEALAAAEAPQTE